MLTLLSKTLVVLAFGLTLTAIAPATPAYAGNCGGNGQKACNPLKAGPECKTWLRKDNGRCRPCGNKGQRNCRVIDKGKACRPGLLIKKNRCVAAKETLIGRMPDIVGGLPKPSSRKDKVREAADRMAPQIVDLVESAADILPRGRDAKALAKAIRDKDSNQVRALLRRNTTLRRTFVEMSDKGFRTATIAVESSGAFGLGAGHETGFAMDLGMKGKPIFYTTTTLTGGYLFNLGNDVVLTFLKARKPDIDGHAFGSVMDFDVGTGVGGNMWFTVKPFDFAGFSVGTGIGGLGGGGGFTYGYTKTWN